MRSGVVVIVVAVCGCHQHLGHAPADAALDSMPEPRLCGATVGSVAAIGDGTLLGMDATRVFIAADSKIEAWSKVDGTLTVLDVPASAAGNIIVNNVGFAATSAGDSLIATNLDDGTQSTIALAQVEPVESMAAAPNGTLFVMTTDAIQVVDPGATSARVAVTAPPMTSIMGLAASDEALVWVELDAMGQHLKKLTFNAGTVAVLNDIPDTIAAKSAQYTKMALTGTDVFVVDYTGVSQWSLNRRSATDGHLLATFAGAQVPYTLQGLAVDSANVYWPAPVIFQSGPPMNCSSWPGLQYAAFAGAGGLVDDTYGDRPLITDELHLYFSTGGKTGGCCCGNNVPCNAGTMCTLPDVPGDPPPVVKCYTR